VNSRQNVVQLEHLRIHKSVFIFCEREVFEGRQNILWAKLCSPQTIIVSKSRSTNADGRCSTADHFPPYAGSRRQHISGLPADVSGHRLKFTIGGKCRRKNQYCVAWSRNEATSSSGAILYLLYWPPVALGYLKTTPWNARCHSWRFQHTNELSPRGRLWMALTVKKMLARKFDK